MSLSCAPSIRVEEPMLSIVATRRSAVGRSGEILPIAVQAPLNSSVSVIRLRIVEVIAIVSVRMPPCGSFPFVVVLVECYLASTPALAGLANEASIILDPSGSGVRLSGRVGPAPAALFVLSAVRT